MPAKRHTRRSLRRRTVFLALRRRGVFRGLVVAPVLALATACSDSALTAPAASAPAPRAPALDRGTGGTSARTETFVYDGRARTQSFGDGHSVHFDANSVCDPQGAGYGPGTWDLPCAPATGPITFTVTSWRDANGRPQVSFSPDVRFVPGTSEVLYLNDAAPGLGKKATIQWCSPLLASGCIDESIADPTLATWVANGQVARRIKHFSGYNVVFGLVDDVAGAIY